MKKTRRIEITAFRRRVTIQSAELALSISATDRPTIDLEEVCNATLDTTRVDKVGFSGKAFCESEGHSSIAAEKLNLKRRGLYMKLRMLGLSILESKNESIRSARGK